MAITYTWEVTSLKTKAEGDNADASNLLMANLGIIDAKDPKFVSMVHNYGKILRKDDYIYRYVNEDDGMGGRFHLLEN